MSHDTSQKQFLAAVLGLASGGALAPEAMAVFATTDLGNKAGGEAAPFQLRPQPLAVAWSEGAA